MIFNLFDLLLFYPNEPRLVTFSEPVFPESDRIFLGVIRISSCLHTSANFEFSTDIARLGYCITLSYDESLFSRWNDMRNSFSKRWIISLGGDFFWTNNTVSEVIYNPSSVWFGHLDAGLSTKSKAETEYSAPEYSDSISVTMRFVMRCRYKLPPVRW